MDEKTKFELSVWRARDSSIVHRSEMGVLVLKSRCQFLPWHWLLDKFFVELFEETSLNF